MEVSVRVRLGSTDLRPTRLGLGLAPIGGLYTPVSDDQATATIHRAWERGLRLFDTAPLYGYGRSERRTGAALTHRPRDEYLLATKVGRLLGPAGPDSDAGQGIWADPPPDVAPRFDFTADGIRRSVTDSLARLGVPSIDIAHLHDPDDHWSQAAGEAHQALEKLRAEGAVRAVSVGMNQTAMLNRFVRERRLDCVLVADPGLLARARAIAAVCEQYGVPLRAAAIQFPLRHPAVTSVVVGARSPAEVDAAVSAFEYEIPTTLWRRLQDDGLLRRTR